MKIINYFNRSLSHKVLGLMGICFTVFAVGCGVLFFYQHQMNEDYIEQRNNIKEKQEVIHTIYHEYKSSIFLKPTSIALRVPENEEERLAIEKTVKQKIIELGRLIESEEEKFRYEEIKSYANYYFTTLLPLILDAYDKTQNPTLDLEDSDALVRTEEFDKQINLLMSYFELQQTNAADKLSEKQFVTQYSVIFFFILILILSLLIIRRIMESIGKPLTDFTLSANEIAAGREATISIDPERKDELGMLSIAFGKMVNSLRDKEQDLIAQNEELIAQQDELQAQQEELQKQRFQLQHALDIVKENEQKLLQWTDLVKTISASLNKGEVLENIIRKMCQITRSDKGIIMLMHEEKFSSYGVSSTGVAQFKDHLHGDLINRLNNEKKPITITRLQHPIEKGFHEGEALIFDLYLPVFSVSQIEAVMVYSRYGSAYSEHELVEYETIARQIAIYLEKIKIFEQSEYNRRLNQDILNTVQEGIQLIDTDKKILQINKQLCEMLRWEEEPDKAIGLPFEQWSSYIGSQIQENDSVESLEDLIQLAIELPDEEHSFIYRKDNDNQIIRVYSKTIKDGHEHIGTLLVHSDITKEYEIAQMKSEFVSTVSHELRTPLASILGFTELLLTKEFKPERTAKYLQTIYNESKRLTALINEFLDIQKMESGGQTYEKKFIDVASIIRKVMELQEVNATLHTITLSVELENTIILGDRDKLEQVFSNLLSNALKYSPDGGNILIRVYEADNQIAIDVKDEGLGIPEDAIPFLFQQFYRVDNSDRRKIGGTGLGLAIVHEIVKAHDGDITVRSLYGKGSLFTTKFPKVKINSIGELVNGDVHQCNIMVIEDDLSLAELLTQELQESGFQVKYCKSGKRALEEMRKKAPDAIVLDIMLEDEIDGWTIMKVMKESEQLKGIPIFVSTSLAEKERGLSLGAQYFLTKPYKPNQLSKLITQTLLSNNKNSQTMVSR